MAESHGGQRGAAGLRPAPAVSIGRLGLSVPGSSRAAGERIAERVASRLGERLPADAGGRFGQLQLSVRPRDTSEEAVSDAIVEAVLGALARRRR